MNQNIFDGQDLGIDKPSEELEELPANLLGNKGESLEDKLKRMEAEERHEFRKYGFGLIIGCLTFYFVTLVFDSILTNVFDGWETSTLITNFAELLKFLISSLIGFVFSETKSKDK